MNTNITSRLVLNLQTMIFVSVTIYSFKAIHSFMSNWSLTWFTLKGKNTIITWSKVGERVRENSFQAMTMNVHELKKTLVWFFITITVDQ